MAFSYTNSKGTTYYLHGREVELNNDRLRTIYFFAKDERDGVLEQVPDGWQVTEGRNALPVLSKNNGDGNGSKGSKSTSKSGTAKSGTAKSGTSKSGGATKNSGKSGGEGQGGTRGSGAGGRGGGTGSSGTRGKSGNR